MDHAATAASPRSEPPTRIMEPTTMYDPKQNRDLLITGARVYTADRRQPWAEALLTRGNTILHVGSEADARALAAPGAEHIHLPGALVTPGLHDSHVHMTGAAASLD